MMKAMKTSHTSSHLGVMFRRNILLIQRDVVQYLARLVGFLIVNSIFGIVYIKGREYTQDQTVNKLWVHVWFSAVPSNMSAVAVYSLHGELRSIFREVRNGMGSMMSYIFSKMILTIPILFLFSVAALIMPGFIIQDYPFDILWQSLLLWAAYMYVWETSSFALAALCDDVIVAMLLQITNWFAHFLFGGVLVPEKDVS